MTEEREWGKNYGEEKQREREREREIGRREKERKSERKSENKRERKEERVKENRWRGIVRLTDQQTNKIHPSDTEEFYRQINILIVKQISIVLCLFLQDR